MFFKFAGRMIGIDGRDEFDSSLFEVVDDFTNGRGILFDEQGDFWCKFSAGV